MLALNKSERFGPNVEGKDALVVAKKDISIIISPLIFVLKLFGGNFYKVKYCPVHYIFRFSYFGQNDEKQKNQLYCLCLKETADFRNFVAKTDEKRKMK